MEREVPEGVKLLEVDPRGAKANWTGIDSRGKIIATRHESDLDSPPKPSPFNLDARCLLLNK